jgi:hypothetical protein
MTDPASLPRAARRLRLLTLFGTAFVLLAFLFAAGLALDGRLADVPNMTIHAGGLPPVPAAIMIVLFGSLVGLALLRMAALLREVEQGRIFPAAALRGFAFFMFLAVAASILAPPLLAMAWGARQFALSLDSDQLLMLLVTGLLFLVARLLGEAQAIADDASQIV